MILNFIVSIFVLFNLSGGKYSVLDKYLEEKLKSYVKWEYELVSVPENINKEGHSFVIDNTREFKQAKSYAHIPIVIIGKFNKRVNSVLTIKLKLFGKVMVAVKQIKKGDQLDLSFFEEAVVETQNMQEEAFVYSMDMENYRAKMNIARGRILTKNSVEKIPLVKSGDNLSATLVKGLISVSFDAISRDEGYKGDVIRIVGLDKRLFKAKIEDSKSVLIVE